jgi:uncharacterized surface protein with fasciclin (FAS1) repeats
MNCNSIFKSIFILPLLAVSLLMTGCYETMWEDHVEKEKLLNSNLMEAIRMKPELSTFASLLKKTGYDLVLVQGNSYTVLAPTNTGWTDIDTTNVDQVRKLIGSLIVLKSYTTKDDQLYKSVKSISGKNIFYDTDTQTFNGAKIVAADINVSNGIIQIMDKVVERKNNIWEYLSENINYSQYTYINSLNTKVMDTEKSVAVGVEASTGKTKYDTVWTNTNSFLKKYPLDNEDSIYTYVVVEQSGFDLLYNKYKNYFNLSTPAKTDSITRFNVCQDFVFKGLVDITKFDTLTNVDGVKVPFKNVLVSKSYNTSNGRVYVINESNIKLKEKIKPIYIEGENFTSTTDVNYVFTRYKRQARGERDVTLACRETQSDTLYRKLTGKRDSIVSKTYSIKSDFYKDAVNFYIEYKAKVNSANYDVYYVAYDDISDHFDYTYTSFGVYKVIQKLFMSLPGASPLKYGITNNNRGVANNFLGDNICFVGQGLAGRKELTKLKRYNLTATTQYVGTPITTAGSDILTIPNTGELTMWLCNTSRSNAANLQGLLFLDYIVLVPRINE